MTILCEWRTEMTFVVIILGLFLTTYKFPKVVALTASNTTSVSLIQRLQYCPSLLIKQQIKPLWA